MTAAAGTSRVPRGRPRVLHVIDPSGPTVGPCVVAMLSDLVNSTAARRLDLLALIIGGSGDERLARRLGVGTSDRMSSLAGRPWLATGRLRRYVQAVGPVDLLHCWSLSALATTALVAPEAPRVLSLATEPLRREHGQWLTALMAILHAPPTILAASNTIKRAWAHVGVEPELMHVLRPGLDLARLDSGSRDDLRRQWRVKGDSTTVIAALASNGCSVDAARAANVLACGLLSGLDVTMVAPASAARRSTARVIARGGGGPERLVFDAAVERPWEVLPGADVALILGDDTGDASPPQSRGPAHLAQTALASLLSGPARPRPGQVLGATPMLWAAGAGRIVIAEAGYSVAEVAENGRTALVVKPGDDAAIVQRLREVIGDQHRAWSLRDAARSEAFSFFSVSRCAQNCVRVYEQILDGARIEIPALPMTGGLAFAGRS